MNPLVRRRLPPSVRSLLTDISPKETWTETETRDGILLPSRAAGNEEFLSPAEIQGKASEDGSSTQRSAVCMLCGCKASNYTCPRCNMQYCGVSCYQSPQHSGCSEEFYKESVLQELKEMGTSENESRKKMQDILLGLRHKAEMTHGGLEGLLKEVGVVGDAAEKVQVFELLSRLAELQQSGEGNESEMEAILKQLEEVEGGEPLDGATCEDAGSTEEELDVAERLSELDIDQLSEEQLWELLSSKEQERFLDLMKGGSLGDLVPLWRPWWEEHEEGGETLVEVLKEEVSKPESDKTSVRNQVKISKEKDLKFCESVAKVNNATGSDRKENKIKKGNSPVQKVPTVSAKIPKLSSLCANPSPLICYGLINALYGYAFSLNLFNGDTDSLMFEFCDTTLALSETLSSNRVFSSIQEAFDSGEALILHGGYLSKEDLHAPARAVEAVAHIMTGLRRQDATGYCLAALSQLRCVFSEARRNLSKEGEEGTRRQKYFLASKKCEFFQAWVLENSPQIQRLAIELWSEHSKRTSVRSSMEKAKTAVEKVLKKEKKKGECKLIEELS